MLHIPAQPGAPIACDMSTAPDTPDERLAAYASLFENALVRRERGAGRVVFTFRRATGTWDAVERLARREAACCPFLEYRVEAAGDAIVWTVAGSGEAAVKATLDAFYALPDGSRLPLAAEVGSDQRDAGHATPDRSEHGQQQADP